MKNQNDNLKKEGKSIRGIAQALGIDGKGTTGVQATRRGTGQQGSQQQLLTGM